jgi:hypothetical protein
MLDESDADAKHDDTRRAAKWRRGELRPRMAKEKESGSLLIHIYQSIYFHHFPSMFIAPVVVK